MWVSLFWWWQAIRELLRKWSDQAQSAITRSHPDAAMQH